MNRADFIGRLTKDPVTNTTGTGKTVSKFTLAVDRKFKNADGERQTDFFNCAAWNKLAEIVDKYAKKGRLIYVSGELQNNTYTADDGSTRYSTVVMLSDIQLLGGKNENESENNTKAFIDGLKEVEDDELPF